MVTFYIVRHGETLFNVMQRIQGWCDSPLTKDGQQQALAVGRGLQKIPFIEAFSSTSERVRDTADYILKGRDISITYDKDLKEINFGTLEGELLQDLKIQDFKQRFFSGYHSTNGETYHEVGTRFLNVLKKAVKDKDGDILIVSHGGAILSLIYEIDSVAALKIIDADKRIDNCSVTVIEYDGEFHVVDVNSLAYRI